MMICDLVNLPGFGKAFVCRSGHRRKPAPCVVCGKASTALCDWRLTSEQEHRRRPGKKPRKDPTCDAALCEEHRYRIGPNRDLCPEHRSRHEGWVGRQQSLALEE
jgi:hypothetical protein